MYGVAVIVAPVAVGSRDVLPLFQSVLVLFSLLQVASGVVLLQ